MTLNANRFQNDLARHVRRHLPAGSRIESMRTSEAGSFLFKHALRLTLTYRRPNGQRKNLIIHANVPSRDTQHEAKTADRLQRALQSSRRFTKKFRAPRPLGLLADGQSNLYEDIPGVPLLKLLNKRSPRAIAVGTRTAAWLGELYRLHLTLGTRREPGQAAREAGYFLDNIVRVVPAFTERASLTLSAAAAAQEYVIRSHRRAFRTIHGDMNLGNSIAGDGYTAMIDFGNSVVFDPASDAGNFLAQVDLLSWQGKISPAQATKIQNGFLRSFRRLPNLGGRLNDRIGLHRAWWILQICSYTCATEPVRGRRLAPIALQQAADHLAKHGFPVKNRLAAASRSTVAASLIDADVMLAFFRQHHQRFFPDSTSVQAIAVHHQPALSTSSFLMRYILTLTDRAGRPFIRIVRGNHVDANTVRFLRHVERFAKGFSTMRLLEYVPALRYYFYEELAGTPLRKIPLRSKSFDRAIQAIGRGLAGFHQLPPNGLSPMTLRSEVRAQRQGLSHLRRFGDHCLPELPRVYQVLHRAERAIWKSERRLVHNDFQASNVLLTSNGIGIIDYTMSGIGHSAIDVANFLAHLEVMAFGHRSAAEIQHLRAAFLSAYARRRTAASRPSFKRAVSIFELRSAIDILAITVVNLGRRDPNRKKYVDLLVGRIRFLVQSIT